MRNPLLGALLIGVWVVVVSFQGLAETRTPAATVPVVIDGQVLLRVRGLTAYPAEKRAADIRSRILAVADGSLPPQVVVARSDGFAEIVAGESILMRVTDADAALEGIDRTALAIVYARRIEASIEEYRRERSAERVRSALLISALATLGLLIACWIIIRGTRKLQEFSEDHYKRRLKGIAIHEFEILQSERIWSTFLGALGMIRYALLALAGYMYLHYVLSLFPQTRTVADRLLTYLMNPIERMGKEILQTLPDLLFLAILFIATRYLLRVIRHFFAAVEHGRVQFKDFDPEWSAPTYRLIRLGILVFVVVVAYPYVPGSQTQAFKGLSIFLGIIFSIGSSSVVANFIAGYSLTYRRVFKVGDWIQVQDMLGRVTHSSLQVTHLASIKNEELIVPNSLLLNSQVLNYSALSRKQGLILHTTVGIGYGTSWRQVEAMLLLAASRTAGLAVAPAPFVWLKDLGEFSSTYELNGYCNQVDSMYQTYDELHRHILDVFNEYGVQIMTPAYEGDPTEPKVVPKERWFLAPAQRS